MNEQSAVLEDCLRCPHCSLPTVANSKVCSGCGELLFNEPASREDPLIGSVLDGKYRIIEKLSGGGMGAVYRAEHAMMNRVVAVKVLHRHLAEGIEEEQFLRRFQREARLASRIDHPNAVTIYDFGMYADRAYLVMQFIEGHSLKSILDDSGALPLWRVLNLVRQIAEGVGEAHSLGIVHRDLKPDNIMVSTRKDGGETAVVLDFGIAKALRAEDEKLSTVTKTGRIIGTPQYMSPEQVLGHPTDSRCDIYALGMITYELLAGSPPFSSGPMMQLIMKHIHEAPVPLLTKQPRLNIPQGVEAVVMRSIRKNPAERYADVYQFIEALEAAAQGAAVEALPEEETVSPGEKTVFADPDSSEFKHPAGREKQTVKPLYLLSAVGLIIALLFAAKFLRAPLQFESTEKQSEFVGVGIQFSLLQNKALVHAVLPDSPAERAGIRSGDEVITIDGRPARNLGVYDLLALALGERGSKVTFSVRSSGEEVPREVILTRDVIETGPIDRARIDSDRLWEEGKHEEALALLADVAKRYPGDARGHFALANRLTMFGRVEDGVSAYQQAIEIDPEHSAAHYRLGGALLALGRFQEAIVAMQNALKLDPDNLEAQGNIAYAYEKQGRYDLALGHLRHAVSLAPESAPLRYRLAIAFAKLGMIHEAVNELKENTKRVPEHAGSRTYLGLIYSQLGRDAEAITELEKASQLNPTATTHFALAEALNRTGRSAQAISHYREALTLNANLVSAHLQLGTAYMQQGDFQSAAASFEEVLKREPGHVVALNNLGWAYNNLRRFAEALAVLGEAIRLNPNFAQAHFNLGTAYANLGKFEEAQTAFDEALRLNPKYPEALYNLAKTNEKLGRLEEAKNRYREVLE